MRIEQYMDDKTLAAYFGVGRSSIWGYVKSGRLERPVRVSEKSVRWSPAQIQAFEDQLRSE